MLDADSCNVQNDVDLHTRTAEQELTHVRMRQPHVASFFAQAVLRGTMALFQSMYCLRTEKDIMDDWRSRQGICYDSRHLRCAAYATP